MKSRSFFLTAATFAVVLTGCDWGGTSESDSWNDAYSWVNFTGTYSVGNMSSSSSSASASNNSTDTTTDSSTTTTIRTDNNTTTTITSSEVIISNTITKVDSFTLGDTSMSMSGTLSKNPVVAGSVSVAVTHDAIGQLNFTDTGSGGLGGSGNGSINYDTGAWSVHSPSSIPAGAKATVTYQYWQVTRKSGVSDPQTSTSSSTSTDTSSTSSQGESSSSSKTDSFSKTMASLATLHVVQKGNLFTFTDNNGTVYNGRITGASIPSTGYNVACSVNISFQVAAANGYKIVGTFTGNWSGATSSSNGTLSGRTIAGTYSYGSAHADFVGTAPAITTATPAADSSN